jgi:lysophospholipase L1-like esterase
MRKKHVVFMVVGIAAIALIVIPFRRPAKLTAHVPAPTQHYVALGDSVAAGIGLQPYSDASACDRTNQAYPYLVAKQQNLKLTSLACSGATIQSGILGSQEVNGLAVKPQLDQLFAEKKPMLISLTIGANDMGWTELLTRCARSTCGSDADTAEVDGRLQGVSSNLKAVLQKMIDHYGTNLPKIIVTGYYQLLPSGLQKCAEMSGLTADELTWERAQETKLNTTIQAAVSGMSHVTFAAVDFTGHELCTTAPWIQNISATAPFHPTTDGQSQYAKVIK